MSLRTRKLVREVLPRLALCVTVTFQPRPNRIRSLIGWEILKHDFPQKVEHPIRKRSCSSRHTWFTDVQDFLSLIRLNFTVWCNTKPLQQRLQLCSSFEDYNKNLNQPLWYIVHFLKAVLWIWLCISKKQFPSSITCLPGAPGGAPGGPSQPAWPSKNQP